jgi:hypothetical protein
MAAQSPQMSVYLSGVAYCCSAVNCVCAGAWHVEAAVCDLQAFDPRSATVGISSILARRRDRPYNEMISVGDYKVCMMKYAS